MSKGSRNRQNRKENPDSYLFSSKERKIVQKQAWEILMKMSDSYSLEVEGAFLWVLYSDYDWTPEQIHEFFDKISMVHQEMQLRYNAESEKNIGWLYLQKLKDAGMDLYKWDGTLPKL